MINVFALSAADRDAAPISNAVADTATIHWTVFVRENHPLITVDFIGSPFGFYHDPFKL
jgi:hypothetical protein